MIEDYIKSAFWGKAESIREAGSGWVVSTEYSTDVYVSIQDVMEWMYESQLKSKDKKDA
jgi:hypothetical protein